MTFWDSTWRTVWFFNTTDMAKCNGHTFQDASHQQGVPRSHWYTVHLWVDKSNSTQPKFNWQSQNVPSTNKNQSFQNILHIHIQIYIDSNRYVGILLYPKTFILSKELVSPTKLWVHTYSSCFHEGFITIHPTDLLKGTIITLVSQSMAACILLQTKQSLDDLVYDICSRCAKFHTEFPVFCLTKPPQIHPIEVSLYFDVALPSCTEIPKIYWQRLSGFLIEWTAICRCFWLPIDCYVGLLGHPKWQDSFWDLLLPVPIFPVQIINMPTWRQNQGGKHFWGKANPKIQVRQNKLQSMDILGILLYQALDGPSAGFCANLSVVESAPEAIRMWRDPPRKRTRHLRMTCIHATSHISHFSTASPFWKSEIDLAAVQAWHPHLAKRVAHMNCKRLFGALLYKRGD